MPLKCLNIAILLYLQLILIKRKILQVGHNLKICLTKAVFKVLIKKKCYYKYFLALHVLLSMAN